MRAASSLNSTLGCELVLPTNKRRDESRRGTHECARHNTIGSFRLQSGRKSRSFGWCAEYRFDNSLRKLDIAHIPIGTDRALKYKTPYIWKEKPMMSSNNVLKEATKAGGRVVQSFAASKEAVVSAIEDGRTVVKQLTKRTRRTVNDLLDDTVHNIKRYPLGSMMIALGVGALVGVVIGRNGKR
jgi:ElaB/YqjD/DUF883 family membrane-anchored ribosome-binding protein